MRGSSWLRAILLVAPLSVNLASQATDGLLRDQDRIPQSNCCQPALLNPSCDRIPVFPQQSSSPTGCVVCTAYQLNTLHCRIRACIVVCILHYSSDCVWQTSSRKSRMFGPTREYRQLMTAERSSCGGSLMKSRVSRGNGRPSTLLCNISKHQEHEGHLKYSYLRV